MFIYNYTSPVLAATDEIHQREHLLFPFMNFTCSGNITSLLFVANRSGWSLDQNIVLSWPVFSLWHQDSNGINFTQARSIGPHMHNSDQMASLQQPITSNCIQIGDREVEVVVINFTSSIRFQTGDILGLKQHVNTPGNFEFGFSLPSIKVLRQSGSYGLTQICQYTRGCAVDERKNQEMPYIAIETSKSVIFT